MDARELYRAGRLTEAVAAMTEEVRGHPVDTIRRGFLTELLLLSGDLERADKQLDVLASQDPQSGPSIAVLRQVVRAAQARREFWREGRVPELLDTPTESVRLLLEASVAFRDGALEDATRLAANAEEARPRVRGSCGDTEFDDLRDLDDLCGGILEVLTSKGTYIWVPFERVESLEFRAPERPRDLLWRRVAIAVRDGPEGEVFVPVVYAGTDLDDTARLARSTEWTGGDGAPVRGRGQRTYLVGDEAVPLLDMTVLRFEPAAETVESA